MWPPYDCTVEIYRAARERKAKPLLCVIRLLNNWFLLTNSCSQYQLGRLLNEWASWAQFPPPRFVQKDIYGITWDQALFIYLFIFLLLCFFASLARELQYSSQIVETGAICLEFSPKFLTFTLHTFVLTQMCRSPSPMLSRGYFGSGKDNRDRGESMIIPKWARGQRLLWPRETGFQQR